MKIEVEDCGERGWRVSVDDRFEDRLGADEALWCVVRVMTGAPRTGYTVLRTQAQHDEWDARYGEKPPLEDWQKQLAGGKAA